MGRKKQAATDFTAEQLPKNRRELFFDCIRQRPLTFIRIGLMSLLFLSPLLVLYFFRDLGLMNISSALAAGRTDEASALAQSKALCNFAALLAVPLSAPAAVGTAGTVRIIRQLVWGEGVFFHRDFADGVKANWLSYTAIFVLAAFIVFMLTCVNNLMPDSFAGAISFGVAAVVFLPAALFMLSQEAVYEVKFFQCAKNAFALYVKTVAPSLLAVVCMAVPFLLTLINIILLKYLLFAAVAVFVLPLLIAAWFIYSCHAFDKYINCRFHPELVGKGMNGK